MPSSSPGRMRSITTGFPLTSARPTSGQAARSRSAVSTARRTVSVIRGSRLSTANGPSKRRSSEASATTHKSPMNWLRSRAASWARAPGVGSVPAATRQRNIVRAYSSRHANHHRTRRAQAGGGRGARRLRLARGQPEGHRRLRGRHRRPPVDPRRSRAGEGHAVRRHDRPRLLHAVAGADAHGRGLEDGRLRLRRQLRAQQGALPGAGAGRQQGADARQARRARGDPRRRADDHGADLRARGRREAVCVAQTVVRVYEG